MVVPPAGIEPAAYCLGGSRSIQLSYEDTNDMFSLREEYCQGEKEGLCLRELRNRKGTFREPENCPHLPCFAAFAGVSSRTESRFGVQPLRCSRQASRPETKCSTSSIRVRKA